MRPRSRTAGTLGGNIANASPAGDTLPVLLAADAVFVAGLARVASGRCRRAAFWTGYRTTALAPDELVLRVRIPLAAGSELRFRKVGTRRAQSISKVVMAVAWRDGARPPATLARRARRARVRCGDADPRHRDRSRPRGPPPTPETADLAAETLAAELAPDRRRPLDGRIPSRWSPHASSTGSIREAGGW